MKLYLIRHAEAIDSETDTVTTDELRFITPKGRDTTITVANNLRNEFQNLDLIFSSPLIRAVQTAEIFASILNFKNDVLLANELINEFTIASLQKLLIKNSLLDSVALVGHEPKMGMLVKTLGNKKICDFGKSAVCKIEYDAMKENGKFVWYYNPKEMEFEK